MSSIKISKDKSLRMMTIEWVKLPLVSNPIHHRPRPTMASRPPHSLKAWTI
jgi:hypothetical protein